ncbi:aquaporin AQPAe.a-like [Aphis craccivora]|uniref:Aquaporin AQPAe.a-like n=1 Tax=Aphis craccivora TaxID=307492 RepID=A0A6G0ZBR2_APHCR|nr:aquaporin AQPAe.a-like [Aphis craccivora]
MRFFVTPDAVTKGLGKTAVNTLLQPGQGFIVEAFITFILVLVIHSVCDEANRSNIVTPSISIGLTIAAAHLAAQRDNKERIHSDIDFKSIL